MLQATPLAITRDEIERFWRRALECRAEAQIECDPARRQEREETALAYERIAERGERHLAGVLSP